MKKLILLLLLGLVCSHAKAQKLTLIFNDVSLSDALKQIDREQDAMHIHFVVDELEDFRVSLSLENKTVAEAVHEVCGWYPMLITTRGNDIFVECIQKERHKVMGRVTDMNGMPLEFANITLLNPSDSTYINGGVSNPNGNFTIPCSRDEVLAKVSFVGYETQYKTVGVGHMGTIRLKGDAIALKEVKIVGNVPQYRMMTGGMEIAVQNTLMSKAGTADDVLSLLPRVQGENGQFTVFAKGTPEIYINNRKVTDTSELKQLKSTEIKNVEVITAPGAQYSAQTAAVIRIRTIKPQGDGLSVEAYSQVKRNNKWQTFDNLSLKYRKGGLELFGYLGFRNEHWEEDNHLDVSLLLNNNKLNFISDALISNWTTTLNEKAGFNYDFNDKHSLGGYYEDNHYISGTLNCPTVELYSRNGIGLGKVTGLWSAFYPQNTTRDLNLYYLGQAGRLNIDFNGTYTQNKSEMQDNHQEQSEELGNQDVHTRNNRKNSLVAGKLILSYPLWKGNVSAGSEFTATNSLGIYTNSLPSIQPSDDRIKESNLAGFVSYDATAGEWFFGAGVRYEHVVSDYESFGVWQEELSRRYHNWFPTAHVGWQKGEGSVQLSYKKTTERPSYRDLDSNVQYDNRFLLEGGNPYLRPQYENRLSLQASWKWLNMEAGYNLIKDQIARYSLQYNQEETVIHRPVNFSKKTNGYAYASVVASPVFGIYRPTLELGFQQQSFHPEVMDSRENRHKPGYSVSLRQRLVFKNGLNIMLYGYYLTSMDMDFYRVARDTYFNLQVQQSFLHKSLTVTLYANDIFDQRRERLVAYYPIDTTIKDANTHNQCIGLRMNYQFNSTRSKYKGTGAGNAEKNRLQ